MFTIAVWITAILSCRIASPSYRRTFQSHGHRPFDVAAQCNPSYVFIAIIWHHAALRTQAKSRPAFVCFQWAVVRTMQTHLTSLHTWDTKSDPGFSVGLLFNTEIRARIPKKKKPSHHYSPSKRAWHYYRPRQRLAFARLQHSSMAVFPLRITQRPFLSSIRKERLCLHQCYFYLSLSSYTKIIFKRHRCTVVIAFFLVVHIFSAWSPNVSLFFISSYSSPPVFGFRSARHHHLCGKSREAQHQWMT